MSIAATNSLSSFPQFNPQRSFPSPASFTVHLRTAATNPLASLSVSSNHARTRPVLAFSSGDGFNGGSSSGGGGGGSGGDGGGGKGDGEGGEQGKNKADALLTLAGMGRALDSLPKDLAAAIESGKIPGSIVSRYFELEKSPFLRWLLRFGGFKERLLADDLFLAKVGIECGVGIFTKTAAEYERRRENFFKELEIVFADVVMAVVADFMLVYLPAPTVSLRSPISVNAGRIAKFFYSCPDNAFQVALPGISYSFFQRIGAIVRNGSKLFAVGTASSLVGTMVTNTLPARTATQQGSGKVGKWKINFLSTQKWENPLMGWTSTGDPYANVGDAGLSFESEEAAKSFAERHGWDYKVKKHHTPLLKVKAYADNFKWKGPPQTSEK